MEETDRRRYLQRLRKPKLERTARKIIIKATSAICKKVVECPYCGAINGTVKKAGALKIVHEKFKTKKAATEQDKFRKTFETAISFVLDMRNHLNKAQEDLNPLRVLQLFKNISSEVILRFS